MKQRCAYNNNGIRCTKPGHKGAWCKAHAPRSSKTATLQCSDCSGVGWDGEYPCAHCSGRGKFQVPAVLVRRGER